MPQKNRLLQSGFFTYAWFDYTDLMTYRSRHKKRLLHQHATAIHMNHFYQY